MGEQGKGGEDETLNVASDLEQPVPVQTVVTRRQRWLIFVAFVVMVASGAYFGLRKRRRPAPFGGFVADDLVHNVETGGYGRFVRYEATADGTALAVVALVNNGGLTRCLLEDLDFVHRD